MSTSEKKIIATHGEDLDGRFSAELFKLVLPTGDKVYIAVFGFVSNVLLLHYLYFK